MEKFTLALKDGHLIVDIDLNRCGFSTVDHAAVYVPSDDNCMTCVPNYPYFRLHVDVDGSLEINDGKP